MSPVAHAPPCTKTTTFLPPSLLSEPVGADGMYMSSLKADTWRDEGRQGGREAGRQGGRGGWVKSGREEGAQNGGGASGRRSEGGGKGGCVETFHWKGRGDRKIGRIGTYSPFI